ncbi:unnamed protein product [Bursaphelenchus okinawaensis]|uniref:SXP/RAL-2 family protein Ani s 5-like cation-binding domain-containing protein n=1 Tax=Bursaphelenchus okinawaensis TaxID=465554 RepID=A0A811KSM8_9BILA|nr:unnamed protein product [Bursaphelenchus okinawaensis]CAG9110580.1 unnamed protein product [Bursaphelenchus okinawaensis]
MKFFIVFLCFATVTALYDHGPAERFWDLLKGLQGEKLQQVKEIVYDPDLTKRQTLEMMDDWVENQSPQIQALYKQSMDNFEQRDHARNAQLDRKAEHLSVAGRELEAEIRAIYDNLDLTDRHTCESVAEVVSMSAHVLQKELGISPPPCDEVFKTLHKH